MSAHARIKLQFDVPATAESWVLPEETMPESTPHDHTVELIRDLLEHYVARTGRDAQIARNLAVRWDREHWRIGIDPDVCLIAPRTPEGKELDSLCTWLPDHSAPLLAVEVVSASHPRKDYVIAPARYAASGTRELWVFDPKLAGPRALGGPFRLQQWLRDDDGSFRLVFTGDGPFFSPALDAWVFAVDEGRRLRIADDREGTRWWETAEEAERAAKEAALARIAELEARLATKKP